MEQVNLFDFPPVCLPLNGQSFGGMDGIVAGEVMSFIQTTICFSSEGWGQTEELSNSDTLKDVEVDLIFVLQFLARYMFLQIRSSHNYNQYRTSPLS